MPPRSTTCFRRGAALALLLAACGGEQKLDQVERRRVPATVEAIRAASVRSIAELGLHERLRAAADLEADLRWQLSWLGELQETRKRLKELAAWCETLTECSVGMKVLRPDLPPLAIMTTTDFLEGIGVSPLYVYLEPSLQWLDGPAHETLTTSTASVTRVLALVDRANDLDPAEIRQLVSASRALQDALRKAAGTVREGAARAEIMARVVARASGDMGAAADRLDPFWQVGAARIAQASVDLKRVGRRARQTSETLGSLSEQLIGDGDAIGTLADTVSRLLYP
ncbi:MAG: hypothetical protein AMXMBFR64_49650 [Myxococcales bacterium]